MKENAHHKHYECEYETIHMRFDVYTSSKF